MFCSPTAELIKEVRRLFDAVSRQSALGWNQVFKVDCTLGREPIHFQRFTSLLRRYSARKGEVTAGYRGG